MTIAVDLGRKAKENQNKSYHPQDESIFIIENSVDVHQKPADLNLYCFQICYKF